MKLVATQMETTVITKLIIIIMKRAITIIKIGIPCLKATLMTITIKRAVFIWITMPFYRVDFQTSTAEAIRVWWVETTWIILTNCRTSRPINKLICLPAKIAPTIVWFSTITVTLWINLWFPALYLQMPLMSIVIRPWQTSIICHQTEI